MVETSLRRSRRIQSQSDDEASVASSTRSRSSRNSRTSNASATATAVASTPTRRSTRLTRGATKTVDEKKKKEELEAIPESVSTDGNDGGMLDVATASPAKSTKDDNSNKEVVSQQDGTAPLSSSKRKKKRGKKSLDAEQVPGSSPSNDLSPKPDENAGEKKEDVPGGTTPKTSKKRKKKKRKADETKAEEVEEGKDSESTKTSKKKKKKKKKRSKKSSETAQAVSDPPTTEKSKKNRKRKAASSDDIGDAAAAAVDEPPPTEPPAAITEDEGSAAPSKKTTIKVSDKSPTTKKKKATAHKKKKQSLKHDKPTVSSPSRQQQAKNPTETIKPILDVTVQRLRFLKLHPKSIIAMASTPLLYASSADDQQQGPHHPGRLAIAREGGSVELLSPQDRWAVVGNVPGVSNREVDALVWVHGQKLGISNNDAGASSLGSQQSHRLVDEQRRLFGCSRDGTIFELDFATKRQKGVIGSGGGGVFCLASMSSRGQCYGGYFAAGCEDGSIKIYSAFGSDGEELASDMPQLVATLPSAGNAILSLAWLPAQNNGANDNGGMGGSVIFAGVADGTIRRFDCTTSVMTGPISTGTVLAPSRGSTSTSYRWKSTLRMTVENRGLRESTKVWALQALSDGTVISGDSLGHVQVWDGLSGTMTQTFEHNENGADVLCLAVSEDENKIFASGVDSSVRCYQRQCLLPTSSNSATLESAPLRKWISSIAHRKHSHDVKALAICHKVTSNSTKPLELLVSGSLDTKICTYVTKDYKVSRPKHWYNWPTLSPITVSRKKRVLAVTRDNSIDLYRLSGSKMTHPMKITNPEPRDETKCLVKTIVINSPFNLCCSAISDDGQYLAASDAVSLHVFALQAGDEDGALDVSPTKLDLPSECKHAATALKFGNDGRLVCATSKGQINILQVSAEGISLQHVFKEHTEDWSASSHHFPVVCLDLSSDGKWLAAGRFSSGKGAVHVFSLPTNEAGGFQHWWSLPKMDAPTTCIKFLGGGNVVSSLAVGCTNNEFYIYNLSRRSLSHWSNDMGLPLLKSLPRELTSRSEPVTRIVSDPVSPQQFILGSHGYFCAVDLDQPVPERANMHPSDHLRAKRLQQMKEDDTAMEVPPPRKKSKAKSTTNNFTICLNYCEIQFQDYLSENEMIVVEEPWTSVLEELPDALARRVYGT